MNADLWSSASESPPYVPLPPEHHQFIRASLIQSRFAQDAIRDEHEFTAKTTTGRLKVNCVAFTDESHHDLDTSAVAVYYEPENRLSDEVILRHMIFSGAPFVFIGRERDLLPYGMRLNGKPEPQRLGNALAYHEIGEFLDKYKVDINPSRISAVKGGTAQFEAFRQLNSFQFRLFTLDITRDVLAENFGVAVNSLRGTLYVSKKTKPQEEIIMEIAVQLLGAIILAHKGRLSSECLEPAASFDTVFKYAVASFPNYFDWKLIEQYSHAAEAAYHLLRQATYSSFTPDMLTELYLRAYPDAEQRKLEGRFDTPLYLTRRIVDNLPIETIRPENRLLADITCGWGSFLVAGYERLNRMADMVESQRPLWEHIVGNDIDPFTSKLARLALLTTSLKDNWVVDNQDALKLKWTDRIPTIIVGNPKFRGNRKLGQGATEIDRSTGKRKRLQEADAFLEQAINLLAPGGYLGMIMPQSFTVSEASPETRKILLEQCDVLEFWDLPIAMFEKQATVSPMVIFAQKREKRGYLVDYPVRTRTLQSKCLDAFRKTRAFTSSTLEPSQSQWSLSSRSSSRSKNVYLINHTTILPKTEWQKISQTCLQLPEVAYLTIGATVGRRPELKRHRNEPSELVPWLASPRKSIPYPFRLVDSKDTILYPSALKEPVLPNRELFESSKVLLVSDPNPSWGKRVKVVIDRERHVVSDSFWVLVPKPDKFSLEVLAAIISWDLSNAWIIENLRSPKILRHTLDTLPVPKYISPSDCKCIEKAIHEIESAAVNERANPKAQQIIDDILREAYGLNKKTFQVLRKVTEWSTQTAVGNPVRPDQQTVFRVSGQVEAVNVSTQKITLWFDGIPGTHTVPIVDSMPGWMLRAGAAFRAEVSYPALRDENWRKLQWWNIHPKEYTYMTEDELLARLAIELAPV